MGIPPFWNKCPPTPRNALLGLNSTSKTGNSASLHRDPVSLFTWKWHFVAILRSESPGIGAEAGGPSTGADSKMIAIQSKSKMCTDTIARLGELVESWRGWNVLCAVNEQPRNEQEDIAHALAVEGRELVKNSLRLTFALGEAAMRGDAKRVERLVHVLDQLDSRESRLAGLCQNAIRQTEGKEARE